MSTYNMVLLAFVMAISTLPPGSGHLMIEAGRSMTNDSTTEYKTWNLTTPEPRPKTLDDFILLTFNELGLLRLKTTIIPKGYFQGKYLIVEDINSTQYLVPLIRFDIEEELEEKLENHTGDGDICVGHLCLSYERTKERLAGIQALKMGTVLPSAIPGFAVMTTIVCVVIIIGVTGNLLIVIGVIRSNKLRNSTTVLLCSLAVSDILVLSICLPLQIVSKFVPVAYLTHSICQLWYYVRHFSIVSSTLTLSAMAVDRYIAVCHPLKARSYCTVKNARYVLAAIVLLSLLMCVPVIFLVIVRDIFENKFCLFFIPTVATEIAYYVIVLVIVLVIPLCTMMPAYCKIFFVLFKSTHEAKALQSSNGTESNDGANSKQENENIKSRRQVIRMLVVVLLVFTLCWGPPTLLDAFEAVRFRLFRISSRVIHPDVTFTLYTIAFCNSFFNPIIYFSMSRQYRQYILSMCKRMSKDKRETSTSYQSSKMTSISQTMTQASASPITATLAS